MIIKRQIKIAPHKRNGQPGDVFPLRIRVSYAGYRLDIPLNVRVNTDRFDRTTKRVTSGEDAGKINAAIAAREAQLDEIFTRYELIEKRLPLPEEVRREMAGKKPAAPVEASGDLYDHFKTFTHSEGKKNGWEPDTYRKYENAINHLKAKYPSLRIEDVDESVMLVFLQHLNEKKMMNSTIDKNIAFVRTFLSWAHGKGIYTGRQHEFHPRLKGVGVAHKTIIYLTWEELMRMRALKFPPSRIVDEHVRDCFLFCCFSGLRYCDMVRLKKVDVREGDFSLVTQKTSSRVVIDLNKYSREILDKYVGMDRPDGAALPFISNQKMNDHLKVIAKDAEIKEQVRRVYWRSNKRKEEVKPKYALIGTHCGRRTFVVNAIYLGISTEVIMKWTGHSDYRAMKPYIAISDDLKKREMEKFNK